MKGKRLMALLLCFAAVGGTFATAGCDKEVQEFDESKSQLFVKYYNGGAGRAWIDEVVANFEADYADVSFEEGKKGVEIVKDFEKSIIAVNNVKGDPNQVYILVNTNYSEFVANNAMMDITDVVSDAALIDNETEESVSIASKISDRRKQYYNVGTEASPKYYAIPFFESSMNLQYNVKLFEENCYYFAEGKTAEGWSDADLKDYDKVIELFVSNASDPRAKGPDDATGNAGGVNYSLDDGLPATYDDFQALLTVMEYDGVIPFIWNGTATSYLTCFANEVWANNVGAEEYDLAFTFRGDSKTLLDLDANGNIQYEADGVTPKMLGKTQITPETAYMLHAQKGKYDALRFVDMIMDSDYYSDSFTVNYLDAQDYFINSAEMKEFDYRPIAMMVEGSWWHNEARPAYGSESDRQAHKFGIMPLPKADASQLGQKNTKLSERESLMFINNYCDEYAIPIAKAFMRYLQSDKAMNTFSAHTDMLRAMEYELTGETLGKMSYYGKNVYEVSRSKNTEWVEWMPKSVEAQKNKSLLDYLTWGYNTSKGSNPFERMYADSALTPATLFTESYTYIKGNWNVKSES